MSQSQTALLRKSKSFLFERHAVLVSQLYDRWADAISSRFAWYKDERIFEHLDRIASLRPRTRLLELGFGDGAVMARLARQLPATRFEGVDISLKMLALASKRCRWLRNVAVEQGDWVAALSSRAPYDIIVVKNTLHLLWALEDKLRALAAVSHSKTQ